MAERPIGERVAANEEQIEILDRELVRVRSRLHELESDRATIRILLDQAARMNARIEEVAGSISEVAKQTAHEVVALFFRDHEEIGAVRAERRRDRIKVALQASAFGVAVGGLIVALVFGH